MQGIGQVVLRMHPRPDADDLFTIRIVLPLPLPLAAHCLYPQ